MDGKDSFDDVLCIPVVLSRRTPEVLHVPATVRNLRNNDCRQSTIESSHSHF